MISNAAITCPALTAPPNGNTPSCTDSNNYDSVCTFTCLSGFGIVGSATLTCEGDGSSATGVYDETPPTCEGSFILLNKVVRLLRITEYPGLALRHFTKKT